jgi:hypothetical protein
LPSFTAGLATQNPPPLRSNLPIPPPPLSSIQGHYQHTAEARARLNAQKPIREDWIRTEAAKITQLSGLRYVAERRFHETRSKEDYENWQNVEKEYADATDLEKKKEERRNLFLGKRGMVALKTDKARDASAVNWGEVDGNGEGRLLGFKMALMERVCVEVERDEEEVVITIEMLATLSLEEKKALRAHLIARLARP